MRLTSAEECLMGAWRSWMRGFDFEHKSATSQSELMELFWETRSGWQATEEARDFITNRRFEHAIFVPSTAGRMTRIPDGQPYADEEPLDSHVSTQDLPLSPKSIPPSPSPSPPPSPVQTAMAHPNNLSAKPVSSLPAQLSSSSSSTPPPPLPVTGTVAAAISPESHYYHQQQQQQQQQKEQQQEQQQQRQTPAFSITNSKFFNTLSDTTASQRPSFSSQINDATATHKVIDNKASTIGDIGKKRKRAHCDDSRIEEEELELSSEKAPPAKRARRSLSLISDTSLPLTEENLRKHTITASKRSMGGSSRSNKRAASTRDNDGSIASKSMRYEETVTQTSQKSSMTAAHYRHSILSRANVTFQFKSVPDEVSTAITTVLKRNISSERKEELSGIALKLHERFIYDLSTAAREDDCIELFYDALSSLGHRNLKMRRKADWDISLKPQIISQNLNLNALLLPQSETRGLYESLNQTSQAETFLPSPEPSKDTITKHEVSGLEKGGLPHIPQSALKTPRPDISIGIDDAAVYTALQSRGLSLSQAKHLLYVLAIPNTQNNGRPLLLSEPTTAVLEMRFPFLIVEGKSYATYRTIYEAQNQAAVSGACALNILYDLSNLVNNVNSESLYKTTPIVFSITTEGPIHELWAHYITKQDGDRLYQVSIIQSCHMAIRRDVSEFIETVESIVKWGCGEHLKNVADQLVILWTVMQAKSN